MSSDTPQAFEARYCPEVPTSCCDYAVISHITGKEVCRVWDRDDVEQIARLLNAALTPTASEATAIGAGEVDKLKPCSNCGGRASRVGDEAVACLPCRKTCRSVADWNAASPKVASDTAPGVRETASKAAADEMRRQGFSGGWDHGALIDAILAALATSPTASDTDTAIPGGWKLVPIKPTGDMVAAGSWTGPDRMADWDDVLEDADQRWSAMLAASPKPDTDTPVDPGVERVRHALFNELNRQCGLGAGTFTIDDGYGHSGLWQVNADLDAGSLCRALAAKPIAGMNAGEVEARQCPHGEPLNTCADCKREHQQATA